MWPDWLISILLQFPVVVIVGFVAWYAYRKIERAYENQSKLEREFREKAIVDLKETHEKSVAAIRDEVKKLAKKVDDLIKRFPS